MMGVLNRDIKLSRNDGDDISEISNFAESPLDPKILWVGTDDGNVQLTTDGGATWKELSGSIQGVQDGTFVGDIVASAASRGTAYVSFDAHRDGDFAPYLFRTTDFGKTWKPVIAGLPGDDASIRGLAEYPGQAERALRRHRARAVRDARQRRALDEARREPADDALRRHRHPSAHEGPRPRHARPRASGFSTTPRRSPSGRRRSPSKRAHLFAVPRATLMLYWEDVSNMNHYFFTAENPAEGAAFTYHLAQPAQKVRLIVTTPAGKLVREMSGSDVRPA